MFPLMSFVLLIIVALTGSTEAQPDEYFILYQDTELNLMVFNTVTAEEMLLLENTEIGARKLRSINSAPYAAVVASNRIPELDGVHPEIRETLYLFDLRNGQQLLTRELLSPDYKYERYDEALDNWYSTENSFVEGHGGPSIFWSPDQTRLIWTESTAVADEARLGVFSIVDEKMAIFPDGQGIPWGFGWSPDGRYLRYEGIESTGTGAGISTAGMFFITTDLRQLTVPRPRFIYTHQLHGWVSDTQLLYSFWDSFYGDTGLFLYDLVEETASEIIPLGNIMISRLYIEPETQRFVFGMIEYTENTTVIAAGIYRLDSPYTTPVQIIATENNHSWIYAAPNEAYNPDNQEFLNVLTGEIRKGTMVVPTPTPYPTPEPPLEVPSEYLQVLPNRSSDGYIAAILQ